MRILIVVLMLLAVIGTAGAEVKVTIPSGEKTVSEMAGQDISIKLPFEEEYIIKLVNKDETRRALVKIRIDGRSVTSDGLILREGETVSLERFLDTGTLSKGKKFKFIEKDEEVRKTRQDMREDGLIVVTAQYEKPRKPIIGYSFGGYGYGDGWIVLTNGTNTIDTRAMNTSNITLATTGAGSATVINDQGITTEGSLSTQRFQEEKIGDLESRYDTLIIHLSGYYKTQPILINR
jgi:hypothetical protein